MAETPQMRCYLMGTGSLLIHCGETLAQRGHQILGVISAADSIAKWAADRGLPVLVPGPDLAQRLGGPFDYFFSITNLSVISAAVLALAKRGAINFHDGPLPRYAGFHATAWALLHGETRHGISWHLMEGGVDEGDLLKQCLFPIAPFETSFSLNTKCYEAAIASFPELVDDLAKGKARRAPQDLSCRTYFGRYDRPECAGVIRWDRPSAEIVALVRALDFGPVENPLCTAKILLATPPADMGTELGLGRWHLSPNGMGSLSEVPVVVASAAKVVPGEAATPGTVLSVTDDAITIAAAQGAVAIKGLRHLNGRPLLLREVIERHRLTLGASLPVVAPDTAARWTALNRELSKHERFWVKRLHLLDPLELPGADRMSAPACPAAQWARVETNVRNLANHLLSDAQAATADVLLCALAAYLARLTDRASFTVGFRDPVLARSLTGGEVLFAGTVPLMVEVSSELPFAVTAGRLTAELAEVRKRGSFARDLSARYPSLPAQAGLERVTVEIADDFDRVRPPSGAELVIAVSADGSACHWLYDAHVFSAKAAGALARGFEIFLADLDTAPERPLCSEKGSGLVSGHQDYPCERAAETTPDPFFAEKVLHLSAESSAALATFACTHDLMMSTLVQGAWALTLGANSGGEDVVFGVTRSCRCSSTTGGEEMAGVLSNAVPLRVRLRPEASVGDWLEELQARQKAMDYEHTPLADLQRWSEVPPGSPLFESIVVFTPRLIGATLRDQGGEWMQREIRFLERTHYPLALFAYHESELLLKLAYDRARCSDAGIERCLELLGTLLEGMPVNRDRRLSELPLISGRQQQVLLADWNATSREYAKDSCIHELFEAQVERTPCATAVVFRDQSLTYQELNRRANQLARRLRSLGAGPGKFVGLFLKRSLDLVVAMLATLKAGAAYVPMDPSYPSKRLDGMLEDTKASVVLTQRDLMCALPPLTGQVVCLDEGGHSDWRVGPDTNVASGVRPHDLAYVIFTSGSSGRPKGVMVEHRNVTNYFTGMDECLDFKEPGTWLAVTSVSFDISVQELLWTLARGFKVVIQEEPERPGGLLSRPSTTLDCSSSPHGAAKAWHTAVPGPRSQRMDFSLFYFAADSGEASENRYRLLTEGARYADRHGFAAVWTPERHFHAFGGLYPNPSLTSAVIAAITSRVQIRAGSVVLPLHNPIRVAEEWSVVDNLSRGRVGLSFASGWHANDFALMPQNYRDRKEVMLRGIDTLRRLWRGEAVEAASGTGEPIHVRLFPAPVQREPPIWLTSAGNVETFRIAGRMGFHVLTNLLGQEPAELAEKIAAYKAARQEHGHPGEGHVTVMLHTFVGPNLDEVRRKVRTPFLEYLKTSTDLIKKARWEFPAFRNSPNQQQTHVDDGQLTDAEMQAIMDHAFERYFRSSGLFGTPEMCLQMVERLKESGVDEIACLIDFGVDSDSVLESLRYLNEVRERSNPEGRGEDYSIPAQIRRHGVTHLQCTPSLARILASEPESVNALRPLRKLLVGGEALPPSLAGQLAPTVDGDLINVYGPTETTIWSTAALIDKSGGPVTIGRPIANTRVYIVDRHLRPVPIGVPGELCIGGHGVTRGYLNRPDLTDERFIPEPFGPGAEGRLYRTGDLARYREDGRIEYLGRLDHQVKIRGYRVELGEIEAVLADHPSVRECVVVAREQAGGYQKLCAYVAASPAPAVKDGVVTSWRDLWDATYAGAKAGLQASTDPTLNTSGWVDSYTGQSIPEREMRDWADHTVGRILALKPRRVLEIGCGTGMLLFRIAPHCEHYQGVDFSASAIHYVETEAARQGLGNVTLLQAAADELHGLELNAFDLIIINSVVQYFPSADYLMGVLERVAPLVKEGGTIFIGDVRSLPLHEAFHTSVALEQAPASLSAAEVRHRARQRLERDNELVLDPIFFRVLPQQLTRICRVAVHLKRGRFRNELTRFRYDVFLGIGGPTAPAPPSRMESGTGITLAQVRERLTSGAPVVAFAGIPNPRVATAVRAVELLASDTCPETAGAIRTLSCAPETGVDPEDLYALDVPYEIELTWSEAALDGYDAVFRHRAALPVAGFPAAPVVSRKAWKEYSNRRTALSDPSSLTLELKELAKKRLPEFMVPASIILLDALPRTPNGKVDRKALPQPGGERHHTTARYVAPASELERTISSVWQELLQLERVGMHDNFFDLGANSLLMVQANSRLRAALRRDLSLVDLFRYPTVNALAAHLSQTAYDQSALPAPPLVPAARGGDVLLSFAQQRLWFLDQLEPHKSVYNAPFAVSLTGPLDVPVLEACLAAIVRRHEVLRTTFQAVEGRPVQRIGAAVSLILPMVDLGHLPEAERESASRQWLAAEAGRPFDLSQDLLLRASLLRLGAQDHILLLTTHHIASDGWSMSILIRELSALYNAFSVGRPSPLVDLPLQYADYAVWQRQWLQDAVLEQQLAYWKGRLEGAPPFLQLATDHPRPALQSYRGNEQVLVLDRDLSQALQELSRREGATLFMTLLAAFQVLLYRYSGQEDIVVGSPIAGRTRTEVEGLIGFFVNTLALRTNLSGNPPFRELLGRVREVTLGAYAHQDLPFEKLVEELQPERTLHHAPLFQVMFALHNAAPARLELPGLTVAPVSVAMGTAKFDLTLLLTEETEGLRGTLEYSTDLFEAETIARLLGHFRRLLEGIVADPEQRLGELPLLTQAERQQLLLEWNRTETAYPSDACIHELFEAQVERSPESVAVVFQEQQLTYAELNARANQLAHYLRSLGVGPEVLVGVYLERSLEMVVGLLGILKAGGAYVPLDPTFPPEWLGLMLQDIQTPVLLTLTHLRAKLPTHRARVIYLDADWETISGASCENPSCETTAENLAYVMFTSGSTGKPKGVQIPHRGVIRLVFRVSYVRLDEAQTILHLSTISFDASTFEVWGALLHGARCVLFAERVPTVRHLGQVIKQDRVRVLWLTAALFNAIVDEAPEVLGDIQQLLVGGEALSVGHVQRALNVLPSTEIINGYGPTEGTTFTCCYSIPRKLRDGLPSIPIGRPIANTQVYVLDRHMQPVPVGVPGELHIGGAGLARGYLNRPDLTAEKFISNPFRDEPGARLYKTGDLVRWLPDGNLEFLSRLDHEVKIRGFRVEPGEIEAVLGQYPSIREAVVIVQADTRGAKRLVAYVVPQNEHGPAIDELRSFLRKKLPEYMVPSAFVVIGNLPLTPNGKVDLRALPPAYGVALHARGEYVPPRNAVEQELAQIWADMLSLDRIGIHDDFFDLGGHSLMAVRLFAHIGNRFQKQLPLATLFQRPTIAQLADAVAQDDAATCSSPLVPIQPGGSRPPFFCVHGIGGESLFLKPISRHLDPDQPLYGLRAQGLNANEEPDTDIQAMATRYIEAIRTVAPSGPYFLGGFSSGGSVAFEMAQQLRAQGHNVGLLAIFDHEPPNCARHGSLRSPRAIASFLQNSLYWIVDDLLQTRPERLFRRARGHLRTLWKRCRREITAATNSDLETFDCEAIFGVSTLPKRLLMFAQEHYRALKKYQPQRYPGRVDLFRSRTAPLLRIMEPDFGWGALAAAGVRIHMIPGAHAGIFEEPHVVVLAEKLTASLEEAQGIGGRDTH